MARSTPRIYELTVRLSDVEPAVWRRLRVSSGATLSRMARIVATSMDWPPGRRFLFVAGSLRYEGRGPKGESRAQGRGEADDVRLRQVMPDAGADVELEYGNGHLWHMEIRLDRILPPGAEVRTPFCLDGAGQAPPIDVGGPWAYEEWRGTTDSPFRDEPELRRPIPCSTDFINAQLDQIR